MRQTVEHTSTNTTSQGEYISPESLQYLIPDDTKELLTAQLLGEEEYRYLTERPRLTADGTETTSAYFTITGPVDFSEEAIEKNAFKLVAETLPRDIIRETNITHEVPLDSIGYQHPPTLDNIILVINAWERSGYNPDLTRAIDSMFEFVSDKKIRDNIIEAFHNADLTHEPFSTHLQRISSELTSLERQQEEHAQHALAKIATSWTGDLSYDAYYEDPSNPLNDEYHERLIHFDEDRITGEPARMIFYPEEAALRGVYKSTGNEHERFTLRIHKDMDTQKSIQLAAHSEVELELLREVDVAQKVDMSEFLDD